MIGRMPEQVWYYRESPPFGTCRHTAAVQTRIDKEYCAIEIQLHYRANSSRFSLSSLVSCVVVIKWAVPPRVLSHGVP